MGDDRRRIAALRDQREAIAIIDVNRPFGGPVEIRVAKEAKRNRVGRQGFEKGSDRRFVSSGDRPNVNGRTVS